MPITITKLVRKTASHLGPEFGPDKGKVLIVLLVSGSCGDFIQLRPARRRGGSSVSFDLRDLYRMGLVRKGGGR